ncbi:hypothetical protein G7Y89_g13180 [Cudoniella acicularis]|uniref:DUF8021 domain-containing protein n=1 Tax=Cudoniella acicularis TaxID=354080 RepID=A0A8H4VWA7_9HELO|nr:hypothetical protein G7Y89_g13180 [Cudoniella acicularis]
MTLTEVPYRMVSAFHTGESLDLSFSGTNKTTANPCDRKCLEDLVDQVVQAMLAHDVARLPLSLNVRYSENGMFLALGDGLWETLTNISIPGNGTDSYAARFADPATSTAGYWGLTTEHSTPGVLALRIQVAHGKITEIEAIDVRAESSGARFGTLTLMRPPLPVEWEGDSLGRLSFLDSSKNGRNEYSGGIDDSLFRRCAAQMDGKGTSPNGLSNLTTAVRDRRILVTDTKKGVILAVAMVDNPATGPGPLPATDRVPSTYMVPQLVKVDNGSITRVESMIKWVAFGYSSTWPEKIPG